jgi:hypothetical protein
MSGPTASVISWRAMASPPTGSTDTSRSAKAAASSSRSAATYGPCTRRTCGSRSCSTTSVRTSPRRKTNGSATGPPANNVEFAYEPFYASWLNRIEAQFQALRYFALDGTDHPSHTEHASMIRRYILWRNRYAHDKRLRELVNRANVA